MLCLITGASSGFGAEFARSFARRGFDLCLVARSQDKLEALKSELSSRYAVKVDCIKADLTVSADLGAIKEYIDQRSIDILVNNAGQDYFYMPDNANVDNELAMIDLNVKAAHLLLRSVLPQMLKRDSGRILNVGSLAGCFPVPFSAAYCGTKSYINNFTKSINHELKTQKTKVRCSLVMPGPMNTGIAGDDYYIPNQNRPVPEYIDKVVTLFLAGRAVICLGPDNLNRIAMRIIPQGLGIRIVYSMMRKTYLRKG